MSNMLSWLQTNVAAIAHRVETPGRVAWGDLAKGQPVKTEWGSGEIASWWPIRNLIMVKLLDGDRLTSQNAFRPVAFAPDELFGSAWLDRQPPDSIESVRCNATAQ